MKILSLILILCTSFVLIAALDSNDVSYAPAFKPGTDSPEKKIIIGSVELGLSTVISGLDVPWDIAWAEQNTIIFSEQGGKVSKVNTVTGDRKTLLSIPEVWRKRTSGLLGLALHPNMKAEPFVVLDYTIQKDSLVISKLVRYRYTGDTLVEPLLLLEVRGSTSHNGSRVAISPEGKVYWATGDAMHAETAQQFDHLNGKILRLNIDGSIPSDNPFKNNPVWSSGFRNMQGLIYAANGNLYTSEHGEANDDEVNLIKRTGNYGWPDVEGFCNTESEINYCNRNAVVEPLQSWTPTIAPAGIEFYNSPAIPDWQNSILMTTLKENDLRILKLNKAGNAVLSESIQLDGTYGRLRDVCVSPEGDVYLATSNRDWNPSTGFPIAADDRIIKISRIRAIANPKKATVTPQTKTNGVTKSNTGVSGRTLYAQYCASCHKDDGKGVTGTFPPLHRSKTVADKKALIDIVLKGMKGPVTINGVNYDQQMPSFSFLGDQQLADLLSYVRSNFGNNAAAVTRAEVMKQRK
jgi:aldose sugar dehydrogenase